MKPAESDTVRVDETRSRMTKDLTKIANAWAGSTTKAFLEVMVETTSWKVALVPALTLLRSVSQGAQILLLVPLMQIVGLNVQQGSVGELSKVVSSAFAFAGIQPTLPVVLAIFMGFSVVLAFIGRLQTTFDMKLEQDLVSSLRQRLYQAIVHTDWLTFSRSRSSDFTHALTTEIDRVGFAAAFSLSLVTDTILVFIYILFALKLSATMTAIVFVSGAALLLLLRKKTLAARRVGEDTSLATSDLYSAAMDHLSGMKATKSYGAEERSTGIFSALTDKVARTYIDASRNSAETAFWYNVGSMVILSAILFVSLEVLGLPAAGIFILLFLFTRMIPLFDGIQQSYQQFLNTLPAFDRVMEVLARCRAAAELESEWSETIELTENLRFEAVWFSYVKEEAPAIRDLNLIVPIGQTTAIVGPSGAGKSTVADLVMGLIRPTRGHVLVDGAPLDPGLLRSWRSQIGYVAQDAFLFNDTVRANMLWACPEAGEEEIWRALNLAAAEGFVSGLPEALETVLGDRGIRLSGGERQRLALARALLRGPSLLILDEATSALDSENERRIQGAIEGLHGRMTILVITHRLSTISNADTIHVLEQGRLIESGNWEALLNSNGRFETLARAQGIRGE
jgi:ATP-binding cassette, subfamily C, bacterial